MKLEEQHVLEKAAIELEEQAEAASRRTSGLLNRGWSPRTATALRKAARTLRQRLKED